MPNHTDLTAFSSQELAKRICNYLIRIENISNMISSNLNDRKRVDRNFIHDEYASIKCLIREDAHFVSLHRNREMLTSPVQLKFIWAVDEAAPYFSAPTNCKNLGEIQSTLFEVEYKLTKHTNREAWKALCD